AGGRGPGRRPGAGRRRLARPRERGQRRRRPGGRPARPAAGGGAPPGPLLPRGHGRLRRPGPRGPPPRPAAAQPVRLQHLPGQLGRVAERYDLVVRAARVVTGAGEVAGCVAVRDGRGVAVAPPAGGLAGDRTVPLADDEVLLPGLVDTHVHVNEPGRTDWEGFASATRAAAAGGATTILDMPLNSTPPPVDPPALQAKRQAAEGKTHVDIGFWGGAVPGNLGELPALHDAGVFGFKCFLVDSGGEEVPPLRPRDPEG